MKIKVAILEKDQNYINRLVTFFNLKYAEKLEIYSFTEQPLAISTVKDAKIDVFLAGEAFHIDENVLPKRCGFAYLVDDPDVESVNGHKAICKFQKIDLIYKHILNIYAENAGNISGHRQDDGSAKLVIFSSPCGGTGTSSMAAACATYYAARGNKTLYLNLEKYGSSDVYFQAKGQFTMSDIIYAVVSKKNNLSIKLQSCSRQSSTGVHFFSESRIALDMMELGAQEIIELLTELRSAAGYDYIVADMDFDMKGDTLEVYRQANRLIWVSDGTDTANKKICRAYEALSAIEENAESPLLGRLALMYDKFSNKTCNEVEHSELKSIGGAPRFERAKTGQIIKGLSEMDIFGKVLS